MFGDNESPFVLGLINDPNYSSTYLDNRNHKLKGQINTHLKRLGKRLGLCMSLDITLARDSYANTLKRAVNNPLKISENMNHSDSEQQHCTTWITLIKISRMVQTMHYYKNISLPDTLPDFPRKNEKKGEI